MQQTEIQEEGIFADVLLPVPIAQRFTYRIPAEMQGKLQVGCRVIVPFGNRKVLTAIIAEIHHRPPAQYQAKYLLELLDDRPSITPGQIQLFDWMADYYMCTPGEVLNVALPSGLKISSLSKIQLRPDALPEEKKLNEKEGKLIALLRERESLSYDEAAEALEVGNAYHIIKALIAKGLILVYEEVRERYSPKIKKKIRLSRDYLMKSDLERLSKRLEKSPKQQDILIAYLRHVPVLHDWTQNEMGLDKDFFTKGEQFSASSLQTMLRNGIFEEFESIISRFAEYEHQVFAPAALSPAQQEASAAILRHFFTDNREVVLLHGVTGSGKTEIYIELINQVLASGSQVLFLLPEIALTTQIVARLQRIFGSQVGVYHSKFSDNERVEVWQGVLQGRFNFVIGVRSAIFLPFDNLGLIIVDEEHESSYKQTELAPRYHARDMAMVIARLQHCKVLLGSATPAVESFYQARQGKYGLVQLSTRYGNAQLPPITLIDLKAERKAKTIKGHFSSALITAIQSRLDRREQVILFLNRRGYTPYVTCRECAWIPDCPNCDVSLTYHYQDYELRCHYCGHTQGVPRKCSICGSTKIEGVGLGTEKIEDELKLHFPLARVQRMDLDTTRAKGSYQQIITDFEQHQTDILVGTQMVSKGLDFDRVSLVGIFDADRMLHFPDFRATERAFQLLLQVSGRAGRRDSKGEVLIQTANTEQETLLRVVRNDYEGMYAYEINERATYFYPPFTRLIRLIAKHPERTLSLEAAQVLTDKLVAKLGKARVLGPQAPIVAKIRNKYHFNILIKIERDKADLRAVKGFIHQQLEEVSTEKAYKTVQWVIDVDPI